MVAALHSRWPIVAAWLLLVAALLGVREVNPPDEPRFIQQAKEMRDTGDWTVPRIGGVPIPDKPPLLFWGINLFSLPLPRIEEAAARLPSALAALLVLLLTARTGRRLFADAAVGNGAALVLLTGVEFFQKAQWISCDMLLTGCCMVTTVCWREAVFDEQGGRWKVLVGWLAVAAGILTKGPLALFWPGLWMVSEAAARKSWRPLLRVLAPEGPAAMLAVAGTWLAAVSSKVGWAYVSNAVFTQSVSRYASAPNSVQPWFFYFGQIPADLLPWSLMLPAAIALAVGAFGRAANTLERPVIRTAAIYIVLAVAFFSGSSGKRGVYLLPAFPAVALLIAAAFLRAGKPGAIGAAWRTAALWSFAILGALVGVAVPALAFRGSLGDGPRVLTTLGAWELTGLFLGGACLAAGALVAIVRARRGNAEGALVAVVAGAAALLFLAGWIGGFAWNRYQGGEAYGQVVASHVPPAARIVIDRSKFELILYYADRRGTEVETDEQLLDELRSGRCTYAILRQDRFESLQHDPLLRGMTQVDTSRLGGETFHLLAPAATEY